MHFARSWRQQSSNLRLVGSRCTSCEAILFPERIRCSQCGSIELEDQQLSGRGTIFTVTTVFEAPRGFESQVPYFAALVELEEGPMICAMLTDVDQKDVSVGDKVTMVTRRILAHGDDGPIIYAYKFTPELEG